MGKLKCSGERRQGAVSVWAFVSVVLLMPRVMADDDGLHFFEKEIRPLLIQKCSRCHGAEKQKGGLRIDSREALRRGGQSGPALVPGDIEGSLLLGAVRRQGELKMPPDGKLSAREIDVLERWVQSGAPWPAVVASLSTRTAASLDHWAFRSVQNPPVPVVEGADPIDAFVRARLFAEGLQPSPLADRRALIRRASYTLVGLPPSPKAVEAFVNDRRPDAYTRLVDRLLQSSQYGEHWARRWLDVARYSDTKGYVYSREERFWVHAWAYRDWVVRSLNADMPYDRFLLLQLAADQVDDRDDGDLAAMGFLTVGRRFLGVTREIIDDRIDVVSRGTMALTVSCARCHDHKYDPIETADYYALYGVFDSCSERVVRLPHAEKPDRAFEEELATRQETLRSEMAVSRKQSSDRVRDRVGDYLRTQTRLDEFPPKGFDQLLQPDDLLPAFVRRWEDYLRRAKRQRDPIFVPWHAYAALPVESFATKTHAVTRALSAENSGEIHPMIKELFRVAPVRFDEVIERYERVLLGVSATWKKALETASDSGSPPPAKLADPASESLRRVLYGEGAPCEVPDEPIVTTEYFFDTRRTEKMWKLQGEVDRWIIKAKAPVPFATVLMDRSIPTQARIFRRGDPTLQGAEVERQFLPLLSEAPLPFEHGSGRLEFAGAIASAKNALTARVIVNRIWAHHFGRGLVTTPSDFGLRAEAPSHPLLLDWLATRFVAEGWSLKKLHRQIVLSETFRQASVAPTDEFGRAALAQDPVNRLLWRMNPRRLTFEEFRDSMFAVTNDLSPRMGGKPFDLFSEPFANRRTLYGLVDRQFFPTALRTFDFANPDLHIPQRRETTVPQQALFFMNHPMVLDRARALAAVAEKASVLDSGITVLFQCVYQRDPTEVEIAESRQLIEAAEVGDDGRPQTTVAGTERAATLRLNSWAQLAQLLLCSNEFLFID